MPKTPLTPLSEDERAELATWLAEHGSSVPGPVRAALEQHSALLDGLVGGRNKLSQVLAELRRALGITPTSERRSSKDPLGPLSNGDGARPKNKRQQLELNAKRLEVLSAWHKDLCKRHRQRAKAIRSKLMKMPVELEEFASSDEEMQADAAEVREQMARYQLGEGAEPAFESSKEALMVGAQVSVSEETVTLPAAVEEQEGVKVLDTMVEERERYDFAFTLRRVTVEVEKKVVEGADGERRMVSASTAELGPPRYAVTWGFLAHMAVLVVQYAMPMNRIANLLSTDAKRFTAGSLARMLRYVARRFAPIYLTLIDALADAEILTGDDTSCRVIEVSKHFDPVDGSGPPPWVDYGTAEAARQKAARGDTSLAVTLAAELGFEFRRRNGDGPKKALHTTTVSGRSDREDPRSLIVIYRSHLGGFGNLLHMLLCKRHPRAKNLTIQSDLATVNLVADRELQRRFDIRTVGCASHARRPFALYEQEDPVSCSYMLHLFKGLFIHEHGLNLYGRNSQNVLAIRDTDSRALWAEIHELAQEMTTRWSPETKLGEGARYITRHFAKLTAYLDDPRLELTNNFSERMLRMEKLIQASSLFRTTLEGRFALDVMRSVLQTAVAARAPLQDYIVDVLRASPAEVELDPGRFTPRQWLEARTAPHDSPPAEPAAPTAQPAG